MQTGRAYSILLLQFLIFICLINLQAAAANRENDSIPTASELKFKPAAIILPSSLIALGAIGMKNPWIKSIRNETCEELQESVTKEILIDNFTQYGPVASVYLFNALGIKGKNNLKDRTVILLSSALVMGITVTTLKNTTKVMRPDGSARTSFPSGHTAMAFMGAEFLYQEFKNRSIWYGVAGYTLASATGFCRMYNNRHWLTDVVAGAGVGILSTKIGYWVHPILQRKTPRNDKTTTLRLDYLLPYTDGKQLGLCALIEL